MSNKKCLTVYEEFLWEKASFYTKELWGVECNLTSLKISNHFKTTWGSTFIEKKVNIKIAGLILDNEYVTDDILLHELCHWYCFVYLKDCSNDDSKVFLSELKKIGSTATGILDKKDGKYFRDNKPYKPSKEIVELNKKFYKQTKNYIKKDNQIYKLLNVFEERGDKYARHNKV